MCSGGKTWKRSASAGLHVSSAFCPIKGHECDVAHEEASQTPQTIHGQLGGCASRSLR
jgi:hypothetical protein